MPARARPTSAPSLPPACCEADDSSDNWSVVDAQSDSEACVERWARLYRTAKRIRRLQRLWAYIGKHLQTIDPRVRERLTKLWPS